VRGKRWAVAKPLGYVGNINTDSGSEPLTHRLRYLWTVTEKDNIKALADAGVPVTWVYTDGDLGITSQSVLIKLFDAKKNKGVHGTGRWDCDVIFEEQP